MNLLPSSTVRLIASAQVITSVSSAVKELIENSLDAGALSIEIKLDGWGLDRIEVRDNGCGIKPDDAPFMAQPHYTSKISTDNDLKSLQTYGFRGEALASLSSVSNVSILTKTESEEVGMLYTLERNGKIIATQPKPSATGTTVMATHLFKNLPVRKQFSSNSKKCKEELKRVEDLVMAYALVHPSLRIILRHNKAVVWQKSKVADQRTALSSVFGTTLLAQMGVIEYHDANESGLHVLGYLPRPGYDLEVTGRAVNDRCFIFFNGRPVNMKEISQLIKQNYSRQAPVVSNRYPVAYLSVTIPPEGLDVNLEPNKTSVMLTNQDELMTVLTKLLDEFYSDEKNKLPGSKTSGCNDVVENRIAIIGKLGDITNTCNLNGEITTPTPSRNGSEESKQPEITIHLDRSTLYEDMSEREKELKEIQSKQGDSSGTIHGKHCSKAKTSSSEKNDFQEEKSACLEKTNQSNQGKDTCKTQSLAMANARTVDEVHIPVLCLPSPLQEDAGALTPKNSYLSDSFESQEHCETLSDKALCEISESMCNKEQPLSTSSKESLQNIIKNSNTEVGEGNNLCLNIANGNKEMLAVKTANTENGAKAAKFYGRLEKGQELSEDKTLTCAPPRSPSLQNLFSFSLDDLFEDSDFDISGEKSNLKRLDPSNDVCTVEKSTPAEMPSSSNQDESTTVKKALTTDSSGAIEAQCTDKDWSMGRGIVDKQGNPVQPVLLVTPGPSRSLSVNKTPVMLLRQHGKRKHSSDQEKSRLSLSSKKIKKMPEITNQPLISKVMSPNPLQRRLLYKKKEIPFCLSDLKDLAKKRTREPRSVQESSSSDHLIGRLDPWGVWLLQRGTDLVCVNQYRIQEQLLFQRLMACHSLQKERLDHAITLNDRSVGGPDCWRSLCNMSAKCDPPDTTRWIDDERLTANGFDVCLKKDPESGETKVELHKVSTSIPFYGVPDLAEVLELICQKEGNKSNCLSKCRPFKVIHHLQGEAVRVARSLSSRMNRTEVDELLSRMAEQIPGDLRTCVHGRPFFATIAQIPK